jgi:hypothetical protein
MGASPDYYKAMMEFSRTLSTSNEQMQNFIVSISNIKGASRVLDAAADRHIRSWKFIFDTNVKIHAACVDSLRIVDELT